MEPDKKSNGAFVGLVVIIIILVIGGIYIWRSSKSTIDNTNSQSESVTEEDSVSLGTLEEDSNAAEIDVGANLIESVQ